jgi:hypothetical protein
MNIDLYISSKKIRGIFETGWFKGIEFSLLKLELFNKPEDMKTIYIFNLQIAKFVILIGADWDYQ